MFNLRGLLGFPAKQEIEILPADEPNKLSLGWMVSEQVGVGIVNSRCFMSKEEIWAGDILRCLLIKWEEEGFIGWALVRPPYKSFKTPDLQGSTLEDRDPDDFGPIHQWRRYTRWKTGKGWFDDWMPQITLDLDNVRDGTPVLKSHSKYELEMVQELAQSIVDRKMYGEKDGLQDKRY